MQLTTLQLITTYVQLAAYLALASLLLLKHSCRRWPILSSLAIFEVGLTAFLMTQKTSAQYPVYLHTYWAGEGVRGLLILGFLFEIIRKIPNIAYAPPQLAAGFLTLATTMAGGCALLASGGGAHCLHVTMAVLAFDRCVVVAWGAFALSLFWSIGFCGLGWTVTLIRMASSLLIFILISGVSAYAMSAWPHYIYRIDDITNICIIGVWLSWSGIIYLEKETEEVFQSDGAARLIAALLQGLKQNAN